jgi:hypothetical protein
MTLGEQINKIYEKRTYIEKYGKDVIFAVVIAIVLIGINVYLYIINHLKGLRKKWTDPVSPINCTPIYLPFASVINPPPDGDDLKYVEDNATQCIQNALKGEADLLTNPIKIVLDTLLDALKGIALVLTDFIKTMGTLVDAVIELLGTLNMNMNAAIDTNNSIFQSIIITFERFMAINTVTSYVMQGFANFGMSLLMSLNPAACFDKDTLLLMKNGDTQSITNVKIGDVLLYDGRITSIMKLSSQGVNMYKYKGVIVSGTHYVYEENKIIQIKDSKHSECCKQYTEKEIYCINTESKQIHINGITFADYDDLSPKDCKVLHEWIKTRTCKSIITNYDIHSSINGGLMDTKIKLNDGTSKWLSNVRIGDILDGSIKVLGVVSVLPKDLKIFKVIVDNNVLIGGTNIQIMDKDKQFCLNSMDSASFMCYTDKPLYHLITDRGGYYVNNIFIGDYSVGMSLFFKEDQSSILSVI